jgi:hypothetical protein
MGQSVNSKNLGREAQQMTGTVSEQSNPSWWQNNASRVILSGFVVFLLLLSVKYTFKAFESRSAIQRWQPQLLDLDQGEDIARKYQYPNPPVMAVLLYPLAKMPPVAMALTWYYAKVAMAFLAVLWTWQMVEGSNKLPWWSLLLAIGLSLRPIIGDLQHGNVNLLILLLCVWSLKLWMGGREVAAGIVMALAVSCKVTPALFIYYFLLKRSWWTMVGGAIGLALFLYPGFVPAAVLGWDANQTQLFSWFDEMVKPFVIEGKVTPEHNNQSVPGLLFRLLSHFPSFTTYVDGVYTPVEYHNFLNLDPVITKRIVQATMLLFAAMMFLWCRNSRSQAQTDAATRTAIVAEFGLVMLGMLIFSERTWKHHAVTLLVPWIALSARMAQIPTWNLERKFLFAVAVLGTILMSLTSTGLLPDRLAKLGQVYGGFTFAFLLLSWGMFVIMTSPRRAKT